LILRANNLPKRLHWSNIEATSVVNTTLGLSIVLEEQIPIFQINGILMTSVVLNIEMTHKLLSKWIINMTLWHLNLYLCVLSLGIHYPKPGHGF